jgi:hypothetical protein
MWNAPALGQTPNRATPSVASPENVVRNFYKWYTSNLKRKVEPIKEQKTELKKFVTNRLLKEIEKVAEKPGEPGADYFLDAQDYDDEWGDRITITRSTYHDSAIILQVMLDGLQIPKHRLEVALLREEGVWKIDRVKGLGNKSK